MLSAVAASICGAALILLVVHDVFDALFHHRGAGLLSRAAMRVVWRVFRRAAIRRRTLLPAAGPAALVAVVAGWLTLLIVGWALVLWPHLERGFRFDDGAASGAAIVDATYVSLVTLATLGFGDITPVDGWLKLLLPLEALLGLGLLTATVSWLLSIHPSLSRRRSLAYEISLLHRTERDTGLTPLGDRSGGAAALAELTSRLVAVERDLTALPIAYYFAEADDRFALPVAMPYLLELAERGRRDDRAAVQLRAAMLARAIDDFAATTAARFHGGIPRGTRAVLDAYARDHLVAPAGEVDHRGTPGSSTTRAPRSVSSSAGPDSST